MDFWGILLLFVLLAFWFFGVWYLVVGMYLKVTQKEKLVPFVPVDIKGLASILPYISEKTGASIIDIGSGWGTAVFFLSKMLPEKRITGVEIHPVLHFMAVFRKLIYGSKHANAFFIRADAGKLNYSEYTGVFLFMLPSFLQGIIIPKLETELQKGAQVICYGFPFVSSGFTIQQVPVQSSRYWIKEAYIATKN